jgi:predicted AlkP superfamily phosphohydrolase/phosphomutase
MPRVLLIGWDGADWRILDPMLEAGALPNLQALIDRGARGVLKSTIPTHSWSAWPSFLTGVEPADHGVYDILESRETRPGTWKQFPVTYRSIRSRTFIPDLNAAGRTQLLVNVPLTFPPPEVNGRLVAGGVLPKGPAFTFPHDLADTLERAGVPWPINRMSWTTYRHRPEAFLEEVTEVTKARIEATAWLVENTEWDLATVVMFSTDRIQHCLSNHIAPDHPDYPKLKDGPIARNVVDVYRMLDEQLGWLVARARDDDLVLFLSDHGFQSCHRAVHMDHLLKRLGFLEFSASQAIYGPMQWGWVRSVARRVYDLLGLHGKVSLPQPVNWSRTRAYTSVRSTGEGVSVNLTGREPNGIVDQAHHDRVRDEVADRIAAFRDPVTGRSPVKKVWRREEVFKGKELERAPDLLFEPAEGYSLTHARSAVERADWVSGDHRIDGVIVAAGPAVKRDAFAGESPLLIDVAPTLLAALDAPATIPATGRVLTQVLGAEAAMRAGEASVEGPPAGREDLGDTEAEEMEEHLRGLGYLE